MKGCNRKLLRASFTIIGLKFLAIGIVALVLVFLNGCAAINECPPGSKCEDRARQFETCGWDRACYEQFEE